MDTNNSDTSRRTETGKKNIAITNPGTTESPIRPTLCVGCSNESTHGLCQWLAYRIPLGVARNEYVDPESAITVEKLNKIQHGVFLAHASIHGGAITNAPYNAGAGGTGNNASFAVIYQIIGNSGSTLTLRGPNPKRIAAGSTIPDPDWIPGDGPRLVTNSFFTSMPAGAVVEFLGPSALAGKIKPLIKKINPPTSDSLNNVSFSVDCTCSVSAARVHFRSDLSANQYFCRIHWELNLPQRWLDLQAYKEAQWTVETVTVDEPSVVTLRDTLGNNTRVLYPSIGNLDENAFPDFGPLQATLTLGSVETILTGATLEPLLETLQTGREAWVTTLDLSGYTFDFAVVKYCPQATALNAFYKPRLSACIHCKTDPSGSYDVDGGQICTRADQASLRDNFKRNCWQPECSSFSADCSQIVSGSNGAFWSSLYTRTSWLLQQGVPGVSNSRNFNLIRPSQGGPSLGCVVGGFQNSVPIEFQTTVTDYQPPQMGQLVTYTDSNGDEDGVILVGGFWRAGFQDLTGIGGPDLRVLPSSPVKGLWDFPGTVPQKDNYNSYVGGTNIGASWTAYGSNLVTVPIRRGGTESWAVGLPLSVNATLSTHIEDLFNGIT